MTHIPFTISLYVLPNQHDLYKITLNVKVPIFILNFVRIRNLKHRQWTPLLQLSALNTLI
jgi:hypothetical protein